MINGSAAPGREFAALQFTNTRTTACVLEGYPSVTLLRNGKQIGTASQPATPATSRRTVGPGETVQSDLSDFTTCQAPLSDTIRVVVPGSTQVYSRPLQLRACTLRVSPLGTTG